MRGKATLALVLTLALTAACRSEQKTSNEAAAAQQTAAAPATLTPEQLGELGARIRKDPASADELLSEKGLDQQSFEKAIRDVSENEEASKRYAAAYRKASA